MQNKQEISYTSRICKSGESCISAKTEEFIGEAGEGLCVECQR